MNYKKYLLIILLLCGLAYGCKKNPSDNVIVNNPPSNEALYGKVSINGIVYKEDGSAADNSTVTIDGNTVYTDAKGAFTFTGSVVDSNKVIIKFARPGYYNVSRTMLVETNAIYAGINVYLIREASAGTFTAATGGVVSNAFLSLTFPANAVTKDDGTVYSGLVTVETPNVYYNSILNELSGDKRATDAGNSSVVLESYGGMAVKLKGQTGENLKLSKPMVYNYAMPYGTDVLAPATLKLWALNETEGIWKESGSATMINKAYSGSTTNLSFMQLAVPHPAALLRVNIHDSKQNIPLGFSIYTSCNQYNYSERTIATINSKGIYLTYVPASLPLTLALFTSCTDKVTAFTTEAVPAGVKTNRGFTVSFSSYITSVSGRVLDCTFQKVSGRAELNLDGVIYNSPLVNGSYTFNLISCGTHPTAEVTVYDANNKILKKATITFVQGSAYQTTDISTCSSPQTGTVTILAEGKTYTFTSPKDSVKCVTSYDYFSATVYTLITASNATQGFYVTTIGKNTGTYPMYTFNFSIPGNGYVMPIFSSNPGNVVFSKYNSGTTIAEGTFKTNTSLNFCGCSSDKTVEVSGSFKIDQ